jgi:glycine cleavage system H protein
MKVPANLNYSKTDEWVKVEGDVATIGVTDYAQEQLSDIVFVEYIQTVGESASKDTPCVSLESVKAAAEVNFPVSGKITATNDGLADKPELVNSDPFGEAWMLKLTLTNKAELETLMDAVAYTKFCEERSH